MTLFEAICVLKVDVLYFVLLSLIGKFWYPFSILKQINEAPGDKTTHQINAFQLIGMASSLDLSGFFEEEVCTTSFQKFPSSTFIASLRMLPP